MTGAQPEIPPGERFCPRCGAEMEVLDVRRTRAPGNGWLPLLRRRWQWNAELTCPDCGLRRGFGWATLEAGHRKPQNPLQRVLDFVTGQWRTRARRRRPRSHQYHRPGQMPDLTLLLADVPFPVYGLRGHPLGLHLRSPGWGGGNDVIEHVSLGYVTGHPLRPKKAFQLEQGGPAYAERPSREMRGTDVVHDLIANYAPREGKEPFGRMEEVNRDWNWNRLRAAERRLVTVTIEGTVVEAEMASWKEPRLVNLASVTMRDRSFVAASLAISEAEFLHVLESLVWLQGAPDIVDEHQRDAEAGRAQLTEERDERHS